MSELLSGWYQILGIIAIVVGLILLAPLWTSREFREGLKKSLAKIFLKGGSTRW